MSKIWVNGNEIDIFTLTPEELSALTESYNHDYIEPLGLYYAESISGDGSYDTPYGVSKLDNALTVGVVDENGNVRKIVFDASEPVEVNVESFRSIADQHTIDGLGTEASPYKVSDKLLSAINSAYTLAIQTAFNLDDMQLQIESAVSFQMEVSAKADDAIFIAETAVDIANMAVDEAEYAIELANSAVSIAYSASTDVDKLYDFVSTLIYTIEYDEEGNNLHITYVDGSESDVEITDITKLEAVTEDISDRLEEVEKKQEEIDIILKKLVTDVTYDKNESMFTIKFVDGSEKYITLDDLKKAKDDIEKCQSDIASVADDANAALDGVSENKDAISDLNDKLDGLSNIVSANTEDINSLTDILDEVVAQLPNAISSLSFSGESGFTLVAETLGGDVIEVPFTDIDNAVKDINEKLDNCVVDLSYDEITNIITVDKLDGTKKYLQLIDKSSSEKTTPIYLTIEPDSDFYIEVNGQTYHVIDKKDGKPFMVPVTGNTVIMNIPDEDKEKITALDFNGQILNSSNIDEMPNLSSVTNAILPSNGSSMFMDDDNLTVVDVNADFLINGDYMFSSCDNLTDFKGSLKTLIIANDMFSGCKVLTGFSTDMPMLSEGNKMFQDCDALTGISGLNMRRLETANSMFADCDNLTELDGINLDKLVDGTSMFSGCPKFCSDSIELPSIVKADYMFLQNKFSKYEQEGSLSKLESAQYMFAENKNLTDFKVLKLDNLENANGMFHNCSSLSAFNVTYAFDKLKFADDMFNGCTNLKSFNQSITFKNLEKANFMFAGCKNITSFSEDGLERLAEANGMFDGCSKLSSVTLKSAKNINQADGMFAGCSSLTSLTITNLNTDLDLSETNISPAVLKEIVTGIYAESKNYQLTIKRSMMYDTLNSELAAKRWKPAKVVD